MAVNQQGLLRAAEDIDLLLEASRENKARTLNTMEYFQDHG